MWTMLDTIVINYQNEKFSWKCKYFSRRKISWKFRDKPQTQHIIYYLMHDIQFGVVEMKTNYFSLLCSTIILLLTPLLGS